MMRDEYDAHPVLRQAAQGLAQLALRGEIEGIAGFIDEQHFRIVHERAPDEDAAHFARRHFSDRLFGKVACFELIEHGGGSLAHGLADVHLGPDGGAGEKAGDHGIAAPCVQGSFAEQFGGDHAEPLAQLEDVPALAAKDAGAHSLAGDGITLAGHGLDQSGFAAAIGAEDGDVFAARDV